MQDLYTTQIPPGNRSYSKSCRACGSPPGRSQQIRDTLPRKIYIMEVGIDQPVQCAKLLCKSSFFVVAFFLFQASRPKQTCLKKVFVHVRGRYPRQKFVRQQRKRNQASSVPHAHRVKPIVTKKDGNDQEGTKSTRKYKDTFIIVIVGCRWYRIRTHNFQLSDENRRQC